MSISHIVAQPDNDMSVLLQKTVDLSELQQYYPKNPDNSVKPLVIMQHGVSFPTNISVLHHSNPLVFKSKADIVGEPAYFLFWTFQIEPNNARVEFTYSYNVGTNAPQAQKASLTLLKSGGFWDIVNIQIETVQL
jgi:hypothetical protein